MPDGQQSVPRSGQFDQLIAMIKAQRHRFLEQQMPAGFQHGFADFVMQMRRQNHIHNVQRFLFEQLCLDATRPATHVSDHWRHHPHFDDDDVVCLNAYPSWAGRGCRADPAYDFAESARTWREGMERMAGFHERQEVRYATAAVEICRREGKPIVIASELGVGDPDNPGMATLRELGWPCFASPGAAVDALSAMWSYASAKAGVIQLTKSLGCEWARYNINVNAVAPGYVNTSLVEDLSQKGVLDVAELASRTPLGRLAECTEIADIVIFLASEESKYMEGHTIIVDGGWTAYTYLESWLANSKKGLSHRPSARLRDCPLDGEENL